MAFKDVIKSFFKTGDYPTQGQFYDLFDKIWFKDEKLAISDIAGLADTINSIGDAVQGFTSVSGTLTYTIPAGFLLEHVILKPLEDCNARIDLAGGVAGDIMLEMPITAADGAVWVLNRMAFVDTAIVVVGMPAGSKAYFVKRKIA